MAHAIGRSAVPVFVGVALLALVGCAPTAPEAAPTSAAPSASSGPSNPSAPSAPSATPLPPEPSVAFPTDCDDLLPVATIGETLDETWNDSGETRSPAEELPGPSARAAAGAAAETLSCLWHPDLATEGYLLGFAMQIEDAARTDLVAAFGASSAYEPILVEGADVAFSTSELRGDLRHTTMYAFVGDTWIAFEAPLFSDDLVTLIGTAVANVAG